LSVATPDVAGIQRNTRSGALPLFAHVPASVLVPLVVPVKIPPAAGMSVAFTHAPTGVATAVGVALAVRVAVGVPAFGGVTDKLNAPALAAYPSTTMKYVCPATTFTVSRDAWWSFGSLVKQPVASSLHATSGPFVQLPLRTYTTES
jgi:hypothetical protein